MSLDRLRKLVAGDLEKDLERLRENMRVMMENTGRLNRQMEELIRIMREIRRCLCRGQEKGD